MGVKTTDLATISGAITAEDSTRYKDKIVRNRIVTYSEISEKGCEKAAQRAVGGSFARLFHDCTPKQR